ncbi:MAG: hypothetical protein ACFCVE_08405 [Phycisphaerae bacterium]
MRAAFGLVSLLVVVGIIAWLISGVGTGTGGTAETLSTAKQAEERVQGFSGRTQDGTRLSDTFELTSGGGTASRPGVVVQTVEENAPFGLQPGDRIISTTAAAGFVQSVGEFGANTPSEVESLIVNATRLPDAVVTVDRAGREITLDVSGTILVGGDTDATAADPATVPPGVDTPSQGDAPQDPPSQNPPARQPPNSARGLAEDLQNRMGR